MAITAFSGMELGLLGDGLGTGTASIVTSPTRGAWSTYALRVNPTTTGTGYYAVLGSNGAYAVLTANLGATTYTTFYFRAATLPASNDEEFVNVYITAAAKMQLRISSAGVISAYNGTTLIATGTAVLSLDTWYKIQIKCGTGTGAAIEVKVDGTTDISTTANLSASNTSAIRLGKVANRNGNSVDFYYDDAIVSNSEYVDAVKVACLIPDANGAYQTFTVGAGAGSHYQVVGLLPPDTAASYLVSTINVGDAETEASSSAASKSISGTIHCVSPSVAMLRDGGSNGRVKVRLRSGSTDSDTIAFATAASVSYSCVLNATDPATGSAWTTSGIDGCEVGLVQDTGGQKTRMASANLMVAFDDSPPTNTIAPAITPASGTAGSTLFTCDTGTWTGSPTSYAYQWKLDGSNVGTDANTYTPVAAGSLTCVITATNAGGSTPATSNAVTVSAASTGTPVSGNGLKSPLSGIRSRLSGL